MLREAIYFTTPRITFIKLPQKYFFCPVVNGSFFAPLTRNTGCSLRGLRPTKSTKRHFA